MSDTRQQRIGVLKDAARRKSVDKTKAAQAALKRLIKRGEPITFQGVQREALLTELRGGSPHVNGVVVISGATVCARDRRK
jgi:hypothetical protein